jgi:thiamine transporter ThiT
MKNLRLSMPKWLNRVKEKSQLWLKQNFTFTTEEITRMAMLIAIAIVLDLVFKFYQLANGGSINLAMVGLTLIALSFPFWKAWIAIAICFALLSAIFDGYFAFLIFDYVFALSGFAIISIIRPFMKEKPSFANWISFSGLFFMAVSWRYIMHVISGILFFQTDFIGSLIYNITYIGPSFFLSYMILLLLYSAGAIKIMQAFPRRKML